MSGGELLEAVDELARLTGAVAAALFGSDLAIEHKADGTVVSRADREAEAAARAWIADRYPRDAILGEEQGRTEGTSGRTWVLDPIDGTISYLAGVPLWSTLVALMDGEDVVAGAIACPAAGHTIVAARGEGCWANGTRCSVSKVDRLDAAVVTTSDPMFGPTPECRPAWDDLAGQARVARSWGDGFGYLLVATGRAEVMVDAIANPWDVAAPSIVVQEAGGVFSPWPGREPRWSGVATNAALDGEVRRVLAGS